MASTKKWWISSRQPKKLTLQNLRLILVQWFTTLFSIFMGKFLRCLIITIKKWELFTTTYYQYPKKNMTNGSTNFKNSPWYTNIKLSNSWAESGICHKRKQRNCTKIHWSYTQPLREHQQKHLMTLMLIT